MNIGFMRLERMKWYLIDYGSCRSRSMTINRWSVNIG